MLIISLVSESPLKATYTIWYSKIYANITAIAYLSLFNYLTSLNQELLVNIENTTKPIILLFSWILVNILFQVFIQNLRKKYPKLRCCYRRRFFVPNQGLIEGKVKWLYYSPPLNNAQKRNANLIHKVITHANIKNKSTCIRVMSDPDISILFFFCAKCINFSVFFFAVLGQNYSTGNYTYLGKFRIPFLFFMLKISISGPP